MKTWADYYWPLWLVILFGIPEFVALKTGHPEWTFSDFVWRVFDVLPGSTLWEWRAVHFFLLAFMVWLTLHLVFRLFR
jgi:hypothetical protein